MCTCSGEDVCGGREGGVLCDWLCVTCGGEDVCVWGGRGAV